MHLGQRALGVAIKIAEAGRKISKANADKLRRALQEISDLLSQVTDTMSEAERSSVENQRLLQRAIQEMIDSEYPCYVEAVYSDTVVWYSDGAWYRAPYTLADDGSATIGTPEEVIPQTIYNPAPPEPADVTESELVSDCVPLVADLREAELREASATIKLIQPGWGSSGYYPASVLKASASKFSKGLKMFWNHATAAEEAARPEGDLDRLAGELVEDAYWADNGAAGPGLYAKAKIFERYRPAVTDLKDHIGTSIRGVGAWTEGEAEGRQGRIIQSIGAAKSVDFVTKAGAGGKVLELFEGAGRRSVPAEEERKENQMNEEQIRGLIAEANRPLQEAVTNLTAENTRLREALVVRDGAERVRQKLATVALPQVTKQRLQESLTLRVSAGADGRLDVAALDAAIEEAVRAEGEYLASVTGRPVRGMGATNVSESQQPTEAELAEAFTALGLSESAAKFAAAGR